jgi:hypothetical protein
MRWLRWSLLFVGMGLAMNGNTLGAVSLLVGWTVFVLVLGRDKQG